LATSKSTPGVRTLLPALPALLASLCMTPAHAAFVKQPYIQNLTDASIVVRWESSVAQGGVVQYGVSSAYEQEVPQGLPSVQHEILLSPLLPDTLYHYRAISGADTSADAVFHMPVPPAKPFRFVAYGDNRTDAAAHQSVVNEMALVSPTPGLLVNVGDLTATGSTSDFQTFFNIEGGLLSRLPIFPTIGNHDTGGIANWPALFTLPNNERWYSVRYGNSVFHILDNYSTYTTGSSQYTWFLNELKADSADVTIRHIFVSFHSPPYTTNLGHSSDLNVRQYLCPLLERFHVRIAFQGHNHCYEHSLVNGVHYLITGGGGAPLYSSWGPAQPWTVYRETCLEFTLLEVRGDTVDVKTVKPGGAVIDPFHVVRPMTPAIAEEVTPLRRSDPTFWASPNPTSGKTRIGFRTEGPGRAELGIYGIDGAWIATLLNRDLAAGFHQVDWDGGLLVSGTYFAVLRTLDRTRTIRLVRLR